MENHFLVFSFFISFSNSYLLFVIFVCLHSLFISLFVICYFLRPLAGSGAWRHHLGDKSPPHPSSLAPSYSHLLSILICISHTIFSHFSYHIFCISHPSSLAPSYSHLLSILISISLYCVFLFLAFHISHISHTIFSYFSSVLLGTFLLSFTQHTDLYFFVFLLFLILYFSYFSYYISHIFHTIFSHFSYHIFRISHPTSLAPSYLVFRGLVRFPNPSYDQSGDLTKD